MADRKPIAVWLNVAAALSLLIPLVVYVACYYCSAASLDGVERFTFNEFPPGTAFTVREYRKRWMVVTFTPLAWLEAKLRGRVIYLDSLDRSEWEPIAP